MSVPHAASIAIRIGLLVSASAACTYQPRSFQFASGIAGGQRTSVGCLDLAIARRPDLAASAVLDFRFGNRCSRAEVVDLGRARVVGRTAAGRQLALRAYDPQGELRALALSGRASGEEALAYPSEEPVEEVCVDPSEIAGASGASSGASGASASSGISAAPGAAGRWLCFARLDASGDPARAAPDDPARSAPPSAEAPEAAS